ncbi:hypothetical protein [Modestobacter sp. NPDC049651]|uniref:hypothetical protein n=1 Tax=unclassified Modestobacter TaxID=2643866 RepID=UPI0033F5E786
MRRWTVIVVAAGAAMLVAVAAFTLGRATAPAGYPPVAGSYLDGLREGQAQGRLEGRAEQEGAQLPPNVRALVQQAFTSGYVTGMNDAFGQYDGGWVLGVPWIVVLERGAGQVAYRFAQRTPVEPGVDYALCADGRTLCRHRR